MKLTSLLATLVALSFAWPAAAAPRPDSWPAYLDYAYVYVSAEPDALRDRLAEYAATGGLTLGDFIAERFDVPEANGQLLGEDDRRRRSIAHLLQYLATGEADDIEASVDAVRALSGRLAKRENRWWFHYVLAHHALHHGDAPTFTQEVFSLWMHVVAELETSYDTYESLSIEKSSRAGFMSALPYLYENLARIILIRSQRTGLDRGLDPLGAIVRMLHDGRIGSNSDVIPAEASSAELLDHIVARLNGPESDGGSLTFTLALFEAARQHDLARNLMADDDLSDATQKAIRVTTGAYRDALHRAETLQGQCAVYTRALRQLGELYAAKQRLEIDPDVDVPFSIERAIALYGEMQAGLDGGWENQGYRNAGRKAFVEALHGLWEEIQESSFNAAAYYLARGQRAEGAGNESISDAATHFGRYLEFFERYATPASREGVPSSAYFAAYVAAKGVGDAVLSYAAGNPSTTQLELASERYRTALELFPFDRELWSRIALALEWQGRENDYLATTQPAADAVARSRHLNAWIQQKRAFYEPLDSLRTALSDDLVIMYLGFAQDEGPEALEADLAERYAEADVVNAELEELSARHAMLDDARAEALVLAQSGEALPRVSSLATGEEGEIAKLSSEIFQLGERQEGLQIQIDARSRAIPLFREALAAAGETDDLGAQRNHPAHELLRQLYFESPATDRRKL